MSGEAPAAGGSGAQAAAAEPPLRGLSEAQREALFAAARSLRAAEEAVASAPPATSREEGARLLLELRAAREQFALACDPVCEAVGDVMTPALADALDDFRRFKSGERAAVVAAPRAAWQPARRRVHAGAPRPAPAAAARAVAAARQSALALVPVANAADPTELLTDDTGRVVFEPRAAQMARAAQAARMRGPPASPGQEQDQEQEQAIQAQPHAASVAAGEAHMQGGASAHGRPTTDAPPHTLRPRARTCSPSAPLAPGKAAAGAAAGRVAPLADDAQGAGAGGGGV